MKPMIYHTKLSMANCGPLAASSNNGMGPLLQTWFDFNYSMDK